MDEFQNELESFMIQIPGCQITFSLCDDETLEQQMKNHYGDWKKQGSVTPIPLVRIPRVFAHDSQMPKFLKKRLQPNQTGERGEIQIFKCLLQLAKIGDIGSALYPNVDSNCFRKIKAHVEIDMVLIHPCKGAFAFNVKNAEKINPQTVQGKE